MNELFPIIRRKRRPLILDVPEIIKAGPPKADDLPPVAIVPLVEPAKKTSAKKNK
jgi:hypothetical protein